MPFIQHTPEDEQRMLEVIGVGSTAELFEVIPPELRLRGELELPTGVTEAQAERQMDELAERNRTVQRTPSFLGGGSYVHILPALVDSISSRSEFVTAYTPYQPEASQGTLHAFFEYQSMICALTGMDVSNASMYDGASALAEAACMMRAASRKRDKLVLSAGLDPFSARTTRTYLANLGVEFLEAPLAADGTTRLEGLVDERTFGVMLGYPNFFGLVEDIAQAAETAHKAGALLAVQTRPIPLGILAAPGHSGADIAAGDAGGLGNLPWFGGPSFGFFAAKEEQVRRMPGRIIGETVDREGRRAFVLTFQPREQHIRREKATSNICTNHALTALRGTIHLAALGKQGLVEVASACLDRAHYTAERLQALAGYSLRYSGPFFNEFVLACPRPAREIFQEARRAGVQCGIPLDRLFAGAGRERELLVAVTEWNTIEDIDALVKALEGAA